VGRWHGVGLHAEAVESAPCSAGATLLFLSPDADDVRATVSVTSVPHRKCRACPYVLRHRSSPQARAVRVQCVRTHSHDAPAQRFAMLPCRVGQVLYEIDRRAVYVIGGIVDRTVHPRQTLDRAHAVGAKLTERNGLRAVAARAVRLPIVESAACGRRMVLNCDSVFKILQARVRVEEEWRAQHRDLSLPAPPSPCRDGDHWERGARADGLHRARVLEWWALAFGEAMPARKLRVGLPGGGGTDRSGQLRVVALEVATAHGPGAIGHLELERLRVTV
jgi:hypothetical protein